VSPAQAPAGSALARTVLAWNRSELAALICIAALFRHLWPLHGTGEATAFGVLGVAATIWASAVILTYRRRSQDRPVHLGPDVFRMMTVAAVLFAAAAFALAFFASP
jgi:hypothetical protein